jgi:uncharacterized membrane protein
VEQYLEKQKLEMEQKRVEEKRQQELNDAGLEKQRLDEERKIVAERHQIETAISIDEKIIRNTELSYAFLGVFFLMVLFDGFGLKAGILFIIWILLFYPKKNRVTGTWLASHFKWQMMTVGISLLLTLTTKGILHFFKIESNTTISLFAIIFGISVWIWTIYRILKGWYCLVKGKEMSPLKDKEISSQDQIIETENLIKKKTAQVAELYCIQLGGFIIFIIFIIFSFYDTPSTYYLRPPRNSGNLFGLIILVNLSYGFLIKSGGIKNIWLRSHSKWQAKTFWFSLLWLVIGIGALVIMNFMYYSSDISKDLTSVGRIYAMLHNQSFNILILSICLWGIYRSIKGWISLNNFTEPA